MYLIDTEIDSFLLHFMKLKLNNAFYLKGQVYAVILGKREVSSGRSKPPKIGWVGL